MKIIIINGSPRKSGATAKTLRAFEAFFHTKEDVEIEFVQISELNFSFCTGCARCFKVGNCYLKDDAESLSKRIATCDALIIGSPTYESSMSGQLKLLIDRSHLVLEQLLTNTQTLAIATFENAHGKKVVQSLEQVFHYSGATINKGFAIKLPAGKNPLDNPKNAKKVQHTAELLYHNVQRKKQNSFLTKLKHRGIFHIGIKPFVLKNKRRYQGVINHWEDQGVKY